MTTYTKVCTTCKITKPASDFNKRTASDDGLQTKCRTCEKYYRQTHRERDKRKIDDYNKRYYQDNKERLREYYKEYSEATKERTKDHKKEYYQANKDRLNEYNKKYKKQKGYHKKHYQANKERINERNKKLYVSNKDRYKVRNKEYQKEYRKTNRERLNEWHRVRRSSNPLFGLIHRLRNRIRDSLRNNGYSKTSRTYEILGCSYEEFKGHLESQFKEGMSWDNMDKWHIDHITPVSWGKTEKEIIALNHYTNLQPMWAEENWRKNNKYAG